MKANTTITLLGAALLAFGAHAATQAEPESMGHGQMPMKHGDMPMPRTPEERAKMANMMFDKIDANKDGSISRAEFVERHKAMSMDHGGMCMDHMEHMEHKGAGQQQHDHSGGPASKQAFVDLDANKDGRLSRDELAKHPMAAHFGMMDADKDGYLSPQEFSTHGK